MLDRARALLARLKSPRRAAGRAHHARPLPARRERGRVRRRGAAEARALAGRGSPHPADLRTDLRLPQGHGRVLVRTAARGPRHGVDDRRERPPRSSLARRRATQGGPDRPHLGRTERGRQRRARRAVPAARGAPPRKPDRSRFRRRSESTRGRRGFASSARRRTSSHPTATAGPTACSTATGRPSSVSSRSWPTISRSFWPGGPPG